MSPTPRPLPYMLRDADRKDCPLTTPKIATCCYCGTRATLVLTGKDRHELACSSCGAPLHDMKMLKAEHPGQRELVKGGKNKKYKQDYRKKKKPKKSMKRRFFEEAFDFIEDILD